MRIIAGTHRSRILSSPVNSGVRPTSDRAKETLFNILNNQIDFFGITCFDLFCGTGSLGLECISRGAGLCFFVDRNTKLVTKNVRNLNLEKRSRIIESDVPEFLSSSKTIPELIFCDPPYDYENYSLLLEKISSLKTLLVLEHSKNFKTPEIFTEAKSLSKKVGTVNFTFFNFN